MRELFAYHTYTVPLSYRCEVMNLFLAYGLQSAHEREQGEQFSFRLSLGDVETAEGAFRAAEIPVSRSELRGLLGALKRLFHHPGLLAGLILSLGMYVFLTGMVWEVRIFSETDIDEDVILEELAQVGLHEGAWMRGLDSDRVVSAFLSLDDRIAFASVHFWGTVAEVELIPKDEGATPTPAAEPCNIVAARDAVITDLTVFAGKPEVKVGQTVAAGDLLVSGVITDVGGTRLLPAAASVVGRVEETLTIEVPLTRETVHVVSSRPTSLTITVFGHTLVFGEPEAASYQKSSRLYLANAIRLPVFCTVGMTSRTEGGVRYLSEEEAARVAEEELERKLGSLLGDGALLSCEKTGNTEEGVFRLQVKIIYETNIAKSLAFQAGSQ